MFEWDAAKSDATLRSRGFDFEPAPRVFATDHVEFEDARRDYGERRLVAIGEVDGDVLVVVFVRRSHAMRVISARRANRRERELFHNHRREG